MKKILSTLLILFVVFVAGIYIFIPGKLIISSASSLHANKEGVYRFLINDSNWQKWWPGTISKNSKDSFLFRYGDFDFQIQEIFYDVIQLKLAENNHSFPGFLKVVPFTNDSMAIELSSELKSRVDPVSRISAYLQAKKIKHALDDVLSSLEKYTANLKNVYGIYVKKEIVQYQNLMSAKQSFSRYPTTADVYTLIGKLRNYIKKSGATELFSPMLNIRKTDSVTYVAQVGIPIDIELPSSGDMMLKKMMKGGNILTGEVTGGQKEIEEGERDMELYIRDYQRSIIAIPFQMLITDRLQEPDSTRWVTRIYYPVV